MRTFRHLSLLILLSLIAVQVTGQAFRDFRPARLDVSDAEAAAAALVGAGITIGHASSRPFVLGTGSEVIWKIVRDDIAPAGTRHVLYQQHLRAPNGTEARLAGADVGVHYGKNGEFIAIDGRQYTNVRVERAIRVSPAEALRVAQDGLAEGGARTRLFEMLPERVIASREKRTELLLVTNDGETFRYAYWTIADRNGREQGVLVDAADRAILHTEDVNVGSNCTATQPPAGSPATGFPVRPDVLQAGVRRSLQANHAPDRSAQGFTYEGHWRGDFTGPNISVFHQTGNLPFMCDPQQWTLFPVANAFNHASRSFYRVYADVDPAWKGSAAGDAMHRTRETMEAFRSMGRASYDGNNGDANIIVESTYLENFQDWATYVRKPQAEASLLLPQTDIVAVSTAGTGYNFTAALDIIAHEWGHGVIYSCSKFDPVATPDWSQLSEGFSDVIGQMVEKLREPAGIGVERSSDWNVGEDASPSGQYLRSGNIDDGAAGHTFLSASVNNLFHRTDTGAVSAHDYGNMLSVVFYLMANGGQHPSCARFNNCNIIVPAIGVDTAAQILFDTVQFTATPGSRWEDLARQASLAAFNRYSVCIRGGYDAALYQDSVDKAFTAIGYPRDRGPYPCP